MDNKDCQSQLLDFIRVVKPTYSNHEDIIFIKDLDLKYVYVNPQFQLLTNNDFEGTTGEKYLDKERYEFFRRTDQQVIKSKESVQYEDKVIINGNSFHEIINKSPILNEAGEVIGILGTGRDASSLVEARNTITTIFNTIPFPMFMKNLDGQYIKINDAFSKEFDIDRNDILGFSDMDVFDHVLGTKHHKHDQIVIQTGNSQTYIIKTNDKDYIATKEPLVNPQGAIIGTVGILNPVTIISEMAQDLLDQQKIESLSQLSAGIAHDLNNYLTSFMGISSILREELDNPEHLAMVEIMNTSSRRATSLIEKLLTFSQQHKQKFDVIKDLEQIISDMVDLVKPSVSSGITIEFHSQSNIPRIYGDASQISQVVMNLVFNGIEAMADVQSAILTVKLELIETLPEIDELLFTSDLSKEVDYVCISIQDTGTGIDEELKFKIFDPFFSTKPQHPGFGLSIVYGVVMTHQGHIQIQSDTSGTTVSIYLPVRDDV